MSLKIFICLFFCLFFSNVLPAKDTLSSKPSVTAVKTEKQIMLTGKLDNPEWLRAEPIQLKYEIRPGDNTPTKYKTIVRILYDNEHIYFGFECLDDKPEQIRASITDRDKIFQDDYVIVLLDTYGDYQRAYEFAVNPYGIQGDLLASSGNEDASIDWVWHSAASLSNKGWTAEIKIPFSAMNIPNKDVHTWVMGVVRTIPRDSRIQISWTPVDRNIPAFLPQTGLLKGLNNINAGARIEILPYAMGQYAGTRRDFDIPSAGFKFEPLQGRIGAGIKYSPGSAFSLEAVINPDFSQIESDAYQISVNTTFALEYEEKRPFFLAGKELLQTDMYYSRSINNPLGAARIMGKSGSLSYLYMGAYDRNTIFVIPGEERSNTVGSNLKSFVNIGKMRYELGDESYAGAILLTRNLDGGHNYVAGIDWNYKFLTNWYFSGEAFISQTKELNDSSLLSSKREFGRTGYNAAFNGEEYGGSGIHLELNHGSRNYNFELAFDNFSPTYQTYNGSFSHNGYRQVFMENEYVYYSDNSFLDKGKAGIASAIEFDFYGTRKDLFVVPYFSLTLKGQTSVGASYLVINNMEFGGKQLNNLNRFEIHVESQPLKELGFYLRAETGYFAYRSSSPERGKGHTVSLDMVVRPLPKIKIQLVYARAGLSSAESGKLFYDGNIYGLVGNYQFSPEILFRTIIQYNTFDGAFQLYPLFSYKLNAFTTFYAGATADYFDYQESGKIINTSQQYFVKIQYLLGI